MCLQKSRASVSRDLNEKMREVRALSINSIERAENIADKYSHIEEEAYEQGNLAWALMKQ